MAHVFVTYGFVPFVDDQAEFIGVLESARFENGLRFALSPFFHALMKCSRVAIASFYKAVEKICEFGMLDGSATGVWLKMTLCHIGSVR